MRSKGTRGRKRVTPTITPDKKELSLLQTQSTVHQILQKIKEED